MSFILPRRERSDDAPGRKHHTQSWIWVNYVWYEDGVKEEYLGRFYRENVRNAATHATAKTKDAQSAEPQKQPAPLPEAQPAPAAEAGPRHGRRARTEGAPRTHRARTLEGTCECGAARGDGACVLGTVGGRAP